MSKEEFNRVYLSDDADTVAKALEIIKHKEVFLNDISTMNYKDYDDKLINEETASDILGFLYESERYSIYLNLINPFSSYETINILLSLYSTVIKQKNDRVKSILGDLTSTIERSKGEKLKDPMGPKELLKAVNYVNYSTNEDGNCFYNSVGMLSSDYLKTPKMFESYKRMSREEKYETQFKEQIRVRKELSDFMIKIYEIIQSVDKKSEMYEKSSIIKYIIKYGKKK